MPGVDHGVNVLEYVAALDDLDDLGLTAVLCRLDVVPAPLTTADEAETDHAAFAFG